MKQFFGAVALVAVAGFFAWWVGPGLWIDYNLRGQELEIAREANITEARCKTKLFIVSLCDVAYTDREGKHDLAYLILGMNSDEKVAVMRVKAEPQLTTTDLGMSYFIDRVLLFAALEIMLIVGVLVSLTRAFRGKKDDEEVGAAA